MTRGSEYWGWVWVRCECGGECGGGIKKLFKNFFNSWTGLVLVFTAAGAVAEGDDAD